MKLAINEINALQVNSLSLGNARELAELIKSDPTVGGVFPNGETGDFSNPDVEKFKNKWCPWWPVARILLIIAKIFTKKQGDIALDALITLGDTVCSK